MMPCPRCGTNDERGALRPGLKRVRTKAALRGERLYRCADCSTLWRCDAATPDKLMLALETIETLGEPIIPKMLNRGPSLLGAGRGAP